MEFRIGLKLFTKGKGSLAFFGMNSGKGKKPTDKRPGFVDQTILAISIFFPEWAAVIVLGDGEAVAYSVYKGRPAQDEVIGQEVGFHGKHVGDKVFAAQAAPCRAGDDKALPSYGIRKILLFLGNFVIDGG